MSKEKKDAYYFKHDTNARNDMELSAARTQFTETVKEMSREELEQLANLAIYGFFFLNIEILREQADFKIKDNCANRIFISKQSEVPLKISNTMLDLLIHEDCGKIKCEDGMLFSKRLISDMDDMNEVRSKFQKAGKASADKRKGNEASNTATQGTQTPQTSPKPPRKAIFTARFYSQWSQYAKDMGGNNDERKKELAYLEEHFKDKETFLNNKLFAAITNETCPSLFKELTEKK